MYPIGKYPREPIKRLTLIGFNGKNIGLYATLYLRSVVIYINPCSDANVRALYP